MLVLGIILTVLGFVVFQWAANAQSKSILDRPLIFNSTVAIIFINLTWIGLIASGFYSLWLVNPLIVLVLIGIYALLWIIGYFLNNRKARAKKIFKIYKRLKLFRPKSSEEEILRETVHAYLSNKQWNEKDINMVMETIFEGHKKDETIKNVVRSVLNIEDPREFPHHDSLKMMKQISKEQDIIEKAYDSVINSATKVTERPELSKGTTEWIKSIGLDPDDMNDQQLAVFAEIDDYGKSNWAVRFLYTASSVFLILALINLIGLNISAVITYIIIAFIVWYIGYKIQMKRISKKFSEASILKYTQEQKENS